MPVIFPFRALHARPEHILKFSSAAYDIEMCEENHNVPEEHEFTYRQVLQPYKRVGEPGFNEDNAIRECQEKLRDLIDKEIILEENKPALYVYRQIKDGHAFTGVLALASIKDYREGKIKRHELTRTEKERQIANTLKKIRYNGNPVLLTHRDDLQLELFLKELVEEAPLYRFTTRGNREHMLWRIETEDKINRLRSFYEAIDAFYIADGHHRSASFSAINDDSIQGFMACIIPASQLKIYSFHRLVKDLNGLSDNDFIDSLKKAFEVRELNEGTFPGAPGIINVYLSGKWYEAKISEKIKESTNPTDKLDVSILEKKVLQEILAIEDSRTSDRVIFVNEAKNLARLTDRVDGGEMKALFTLFPVAIQDVLHISDVHETMPPKSTWIEPKLRSGLLMQHF
jgi:uncharacterized protein (DUF1015 family)